MRDCGRGRGRSGGGGGGDAATGGIGLGDGRDLAAEVGVGEFPFSPQRGGHAATVGIGAWR
jgi:hypothetical protein